MKTMNDEACPRTSPHRRNRRTGAASGGRPSLGRGQVLGAAMTMALLSAENASARGSIPVLLQITRNTTGTISDPRIRSQDGDSIVFTSDGDVTGPSPGHNEVYYYDRNSGMTTRVTTTTGGESREGARATDTVGGADRPEQITFVSTGDLDPSVGNVDGNPEIFIWTKNDNTIHQLTNTTGGVINKDPYVSDSGRCIVFSSNGNIGANPGNNPGVPDPGFSNVDGSFEIFQYSLLSTDGYPQDGIMTQISSGLAGTESHEPVVGGYIFQRQCQYTAYTSDYDQLGNGATGTNIYLYDRESAETTMMETDELPWSIQPGNYSHPSISAASPFARGPFVAFQTDADEWRNGSDGMEIFRFRAFHPRMTQYTDYLTGSYERPAISDGGGFIVFQADGEVIDAQHGAKVGGPPPYNADGNSEIFRMKGTRKAWQITRSTGCTNDFPTARDDSTSLAFRSDCDLIPGNNLGGVQQVFLYREVFGSDPLSTAGGCLQINGCCNEANGCYQPIYGKKPDARKKGCIDSVKGCKTLEQ